MFSALFEAHAVGGFRGFARDDGGRGVGGGLRHADRDVARLPRLAGFTDHGGTVQRA